MVDFKKLARSQREPIVESIIEQGGEFYVPPKPTDELPYRNSPLAIPKRLESIAKEITEVAYDS